MDGQLWHKKNQRYKIGIYFQIEAVTSWRETINRNNPNEILW